MEVKLLACTGLAEGTPPVPGCTEADSVIIYAVSQCYQAKPQPGMIRNCFERGHHSVFEHVHFSFAVHGISRACLAQLTRHRLASYTVESQRYCDYTKKPAGFVWPDTIEGGTAKKYRALLEQAMTCYHELRAAGVPPEDARFVLPQATAVNLVFTMNARELFHCFDLRLDRHAQWEIRRLFARVLQLVRERAPLTFAAYADRKEEL
ncbi:thymidylate synthase, flavin-dependent [Desulfotomaculum copahuensis]|uniref:Flavin-dependent thymidylate synthase n=1 Tax=Desulfotomaculum copahuensis TaxID=1838280 RepID=A0A1B7LB83_9FIRM|nr:thymidylate synthase, flavin-dependent [Desulfotomaculum copahuensis]